MGTQAQKIVDYDLKKLIEHLNKALSDEWLATFQYWVGSKVVKGPFSPLVAKELAEHSKEEYEHAELLTNRIIVLGGTPVLEPKDWYKFSTCGFKKPTIFREIGLLEDNIKSERCAIAVYNNLLKEIRGKDDVTFNLIEQIMEDEIEHEEDLQRILEDIKLK
ncbi:MAG: ferritin [Chlamydiae bacterium RIFCSPHIGHO2_12_FULL_27_8]|nr:MAG: ferritin [Chlamydiae bacterium RIFCSPHIGHO2_12_FULL_27_8]OGN65792.1 MAG: ferritin [Chlamydiae bacterium RIFCSPLOWO2_01_FULL_28_7]